MKLLKKSAFGLLLGMGALQPQAQVNVQTFTTTFNTKYYLMEDAQHMDINESEYKYRLFFKALYNYTDAPLTITNKQRTEYYQDAYSNLNTLDLGAGTYFSNGVFIGAALPVHKIENYRGESTNSLGDARIISKIRLNEKTAKTNFSLIPEITLPTGDENRFLSDGSFAPALKVAAERRFGIVDVAMNVGYKYAKEATFSDIDYRDRVLYGIGAYVPFTDDLGFNVEYQGAFVFNNSEYHQPGTLYAGANYKFTKNVTGYAGAGVSNVEESNSSDYRVVVGVKVMPDAGRATSQSLRISKAATQKRRAVVKKVSKPVRVVVTKKRLKLSEEVLFEHDSSTLTFRAKEILDEVAAVIIKNMNRFDHIKLKGHANYLGDYDYNVALSKRRVKAVRAYLMYKGVPSDMLKLWAFGEYRPRQDIAQTKNNQLVLNRRVEFLISPFASKTAYRKRIQRINTSQAATKKTVIVRKKPIKVVFTPKKLKLSEEVLFEHDSAELTARAKEILNEIIPVVLSNKTKFKHIKLKGHANHLGNYNYNIGLSQRRVKAVHDYLVAHGLPSNLVAMWAYGEARPRQDIAQTEDNKLVLNRRVEFLVVK